MTKTDVTNQYPEGWDYEWVWVDRDGYLAVFTTAGVGPIPLFVQEARPQADDVIDLIYDLPRQGDFELLVNLPRPDDFIGFAQRGLYSYDWADIHRTSGKSGKYEIQSKPKNPLPSSEFADALRLYLPNQCFPLLFADTLAIDVQKYHSCGSLA